MKELIRAYQNFKAIPFPDGLAGEEIEGIDLILLDSATAGTIDKYIGKNGTLNQKDIDKAQECGAVLNLVLKRLEGSQKEYFEQLELMIREILITLK